MPYLGLEKFPHLTPCQLANFLRDNCSSCYTYMILLQFNFNRDILASNEGRHWTIRHGVILFKNHVYFCCGSPFITHALQHGHASLSVGHARFHKTYRNAPLISIGQKNSDVQRFVTKCDNSQCHKVDTIPYQDLFQYNSIPNQKWEDFITSLPLFAGKNVTFVVVNHLTNYAHSIPLTTKSTTFLAYYLFIDNVYNLH